MQLTLISAPFRPSSPLTGSERVLYRAANMKERGNPNGITYLEAYAGSKNLNEPIPIPRPRGAAQGQPTDQVRGAGNRQPTIDPEQDSNRPLLRAMRLVVRRTVSPRQQPEPHVDDAWRQGGYGVPEGVS